MHRIYFEKRCLTVCSPGDSVLTDPNTVEFHPSGREDVHRLVRMLREEGYPGSICIGEEDEEACYAATDSGTCRKGTRKPGRTSGSPPCVKSRKRRGSKNW